MSRVFIAGAGGIGCAVGYALRCAGVPVTLIDNNAKKILDGRRHGVRVGSLSPLSAAFLHFDEWRPRPPATVFLCTKCYDNQAVLERLGMENHSLPDPPPREGGVLPGIELVPIQNGFDASLDRLSFPIEGIASFVSECRPDQAHTNITRPGKLHFGGRHERYSHHPIIKPLRRSRLFQLREVEQILPYKYTKLLYNAAISPLAAAAGVDNGQLLAHPQARALFFGLIQENYGILRRAGMPLARIGPFHPDRVQTILRKPLLARLMGWAFYPSLRGTYCSMSGDLAKGRTELDNYTGYLLKLALADAGPLNRRIYAVLKRMESESARPGMAVLEELTNIID